MAPLLHLLSALVFGAAGLALFVMLLNRRLIMVGNGPTKGPILAAIGVAMTIAPAWLTVGRDALPWAIVPTGVLGLLLLGEGQRLRIRKRCAGGTPIIEASARAASSLTTTALQVASYELAAPTWEGGAFRIVQLSDLHVTDALPFSYFEGVMARAEALHPDIPTSRLIAAGDRAR